MTETVTLNFEKIKWSYEGSQRNEDSFDFSASARGATADGDHDNWIDILAIDWGAHEPAAEVVQSAGLRSDGELVQAVSDADMSGDFIF